MNNIPIGPKNYTNGDSVSYIHTGINNCSFTQPGMPYWCVYPPYYVNDFFPYPCITDYTTKLVWDFELNQLELENAELKNKLKIKQLKEENEALRKQLGQSV